MSWIMKRTLHSVTLFAQHETYSIIDNSIKTDDIFRVISISFSTRGFLCCYNRNWSKITYKISVVHIGHWHIFSLPNAVCGTHQRFGFSQTNLVIRWQICGFFHKTARRMQSSARIDCCYLSSSNVGASLILLYINIFTASSYVRRCVGTTFLLYRIAQCNCHNAGVELGDGRVIYTMVYFSDCSELPQRKQIDDNFCVRSVPKVRKWLFAGQNTQAN